MNVLETCGLGKRYGRTWALQDLTVAVPEGRITALVGPNGAGKSTLLSLAAGLTAPTWGTVTVLGGERPGTPRALAGLAFVAQGAPLYSALSVADTIRVVASLNDNFDVAAARSWVEQHEIPLERRVGALSGGQHAQVALAVTLARHPRLLVLDEPVASLDPLARHAVLSMLMTAVAEDGLSVILSSHVVAELQRVCDHLVILSAGGVQVLGDVDDLLDDHVLVTGRPADVDEFTRNRAVPRRWTAERQTTALVRGVLPDVLPPGLAVASTNLEELVLAYMRSPHLHALPGPRRLVEVRA